MEEKQSMDLLSDSNVSSRRDFMKTAGKLAIYTPPAIMLFMHPNRKAIACSFKRPARRHFRHFGPNHFDGFHQKKR